MSISSIDSNINLIMQNMQSQNRQSEPPLKDKVDAMTEEQRTEFDSKIESFSPKQMSNFMNLMKDNEFEISDMSQEEAVTAIFDLLEQTQSIDSVSATDLISALDALEETAPSSGRMLPSQTSGEAQDPLANLTEEDMTSFIEIIDSMNNDQKQEFGFMLMESKDQLSTLDSTESAQMVLAMLKEASQSTDSSLTQNALSSFTRGGSFLDIYS